MNLISNQIQFSYFSKLLLTKLEQKESYLVCLFARKKYFEPLRSNKSLLMKWETKGGKDLYREISNLNVEGFFQEIPGTNEKIEIPREAMALYITLNPRSTKQASTNTVVKGVQYIAEGRSFNAGQEYLHQLQTGDCISRRIFFDFDVDLPKELAGQDNTEVISQRLKTLRGKINLDCITVLNTRGGFHLLVEKDQIEEEYKNTWYKDLSNLEGVDIQKTKQGKNVSVTATLIPIPGTFQGGYPVNIQNFNI